MKVLATLAAGPLFNQRVDRFPAAQIEIADAEVGALGDLKRVPQRWQEVGGDVVEYAATCSAVRGGPSY